MFGCGGNYFYLSVHDTSFKVAAYSINNYISTSFLSTAKKKEVCSISAQNSFTLFFSRSWLILYLVCLRHLLSCVILWDQIRGHKCSERLKKTSGEQVFKDYFWTDLSFLGCSLVWISINWQNDRVSLNYCQIWKLLQQKMHL